MKIKNIKYYLTSLLLALNISLVGCGSEKEVEIVDAEVTDISSEGKIELPQFDRIISDILGEDKEALLNFDNPFSLEKEAESTEELIDFDKILQHSLEVEEENKPIEEKVDEVATKEVETMEETKEKSSSAEELKQLKTVREIYIIGNSKDNGYEIQYTTEDEANSLNYLVKEGIDETHEFLNTLIFTSDSSINFLNCEDLEILNAISHPEVIKNMGMKRCSISDISCLEPFKNLENLRIQNCPSLENIDTLECLTKLQGISILGTNVSDIHSLSYLKDVVLLDLRCNKIEDVSPLQNLPKLQYIYLTYNRISDAESLNFLAEKGLISEYAKYLISATYWKHDIGIVLEKYQDQTNFHQLMIQKLDSKEDFYGGGYFVEIQDNQGDLCQYSLVNKYDDPYYFKNTYEEIVLSNIDDLSMLEKVQNKDAVTKIDIQSGTLSSLEGIDAFQNVTTLTIRNCDRLSEISELSNMPNLSSIIIKNTPITEIHSLSNLQDLEYLWLTYTYVDDINPILELPNLKEVYFAWNKGTNIEDIRILEEKVPYVMWNLGKRNIYKERVKEYTE